MRCYSFRANITLIPLWPKVAHWACTLQGRRNGGLAAPHKAGKFRPRVANPELRVCVSRFGPVSLSVHPKLTDDCSSSTASVSTFVRATTHEGVAHPRWCSIANLVTQLVTNGIKRT